MLTFPGYSFIRTSICVGVEPLLPTLPFKAISNFNAIVTTTKNQQNEEQRKKKYTAYSQLNMIPPKSTRRIVAVKQGQ